MSVTPMKAVDRPMANLSFNQALAVARAVACERMPYFRAGIVDLVPREAPGLGTMALTAGSILMVDPDVLKAWSPNQAAAVLIHEYMHSFLKHSERFKKLVLSGTLASTAEDQALWNQMADAEINDDLEQAGLELPTFTAADGQVHKPVTPDGLGQPNNRLAEEYLKNELSKRPKDRRPPGGGGGSGHCGSCTHNPVPGEPPISDPDARSEIDQDVTRKQVVEDIKAQASRGQGRLPDGLRRLLGDELKEAKVPWQQKLSRSARAAVSFRPGAVDYTRAKPSRRQGAVRHLRPAPILPGMHAPKAEVALVADTSGSMGANEMRAVLDEAQGILKAIGGSEVSFIACDAVVHSIVRTRSVKEMELNMHGGGGTDFKPAFDALAKLKPRPQVVVFATDGYGDYPPAPPKGMQVIWLVVAGGRIAVPWGEVISADERDDEDLRDPDEYLEEDDDGDDAPDSDP